MTSRPVAQQTKVLAYAAIIFFLIALAAFLWLRELSNDIKTGTNGTIDASEEIPIDVENLFNE